MSGVEVLRNWLTLIPKGGSILDVGAGSGDPLMSVVLDAGFKPYAIDASQALVTAFKERFPKVPIDCETVEDSDFFNRKFDGVMAIGLIFLLPKDRQPYALERMIEALLPRGRLLFSAPKQVGTWTDMLTDLPSWSLGAAEYKRIMENCGLQPLPEQVDEGGICYYDAVKA